MKTIILLFVISISKTRSAPAKHHLYYQGDGVELLDINNFKQEVENSSTAWLVEFYASWCGDCQRFVPLWKALAEDLRPWQDKVKVAVIPCSDEINTPICRQYKIARYPTVKYFPEKYQTSQDNLGVDVVHDEHITKPLLQKRIDKILRKEVNEGRGGMYPDLRPWRSTQLDHLFEQVPDEVKFIFLLVEPEDSYLGLELTLDLHKTPFIRIRYSLDSNTELIQRLKIKEIPSLLVVERSGTSEVISNGTSSKHDLRSTIEKFLQSKDLELLEDDNLDNVTSKPDTEDSSNKILRDHIKKMGDVIFQMDLEAALRYSLKTEVATATLIKGPQLQALNEYLSVIKDYFPFGYNNSRFITKLTNLTSSSPEVAGTDIETLIREAEKNRVFSSPQKFLGCLGSASRYKGYPCGLWRLFHYLTVNSLDNNTDDPKRVLNAMHGYVKHFFSCKHCSEHFQKMAIERNMQGVSCLDQAVLWLWDAHNAVNKRLKGDATEDPEYPKEQFPTKKNCPECYDGKGEWKNSEVLKYLNRMYGRFNVRYLGADTTVLFPGLD